MTSICDVIYNYKYKLFMQFFYNHINLMDQYLFKTREVQLLTVVLTTVQHQ